MPSARAARVLHGGKRPAHLNKGHFLEPTVLTDVSDDARIMSEEPFAPIAPILSFADEDEVIARANALPFGLASYVFSNDAERAQRTAERIEAGMVGINEMLLAAAESALRRHQGIGLWPRGRRARHQGLPRAEIHPPQADQDGVRTGPRTGGF